MTMIKNRFTKGILHCVVFLGRREGLDVLVGSLAFWMVSICVMFVAAALGERDMAVILGNSALIGPMLFWLAWLISGAMHEGCEDLLREWHRQPQDISHSVLPPIPDEPHRAILEASRLLRDPGCEAASARLIGLLEAWGDRNLSTATASRRKISHAVAVVEEMAGKVSYMTAGDPRQVPATFKSALDWTADLIEAELDTHNQAISDDVAQDLRVLQSQGSLS